MNLSENNSLGQLWSVEDVEYPENGCETLLASDRTPIGFDPWEISVLGKNGFSQSEVVRSWNSIKVVQIGQRTKLTASLNKLIMLFLTFYFCVSLPENPTSDFRLLSLLNETQVFLNLLGICSLWAVRLAFSRWRKSFASFLVSQSALILKEQFHLVQTKTRNLVEVEEHLFSSQIALINLNLCSAKILYYFALQSMHIKPVLSLFQRHFTLLN